MESDYLNFKIIFIQKFKVNCQGQGQMSFSPEIAEKMPFTDFFHATKNLRSL